MSHSVLEVGQIVKQIKDAFRPLVCKVEIWDYNTKIRLKVLHEDKKLYEKNSVQIDDLTVSPEGLATYVNTVRHIVHEKIRGTKPNFEFIDPDLEA